MVDSIHPEKVQCHHCVDQALHQEDDTQIWCRDSDQCGARMELNRTNNNAMWRDMLMNVGMAFKVLDEGQKAPAGWHKVTGHLIWDVKMDFTRKVRWVLDGHKTTDPTGLTFAGLCLERVCTLPSLM